MPSSTPSVVDGVSTLPIAEVRATLQTASESTSAQHPLVDQPLRCIRRECAGLYKAQAQIHTSETSCRRQKNTMLNAGPPKWQACDQRQRQPYATDAKLTLKVQLLYVAQQTCVVCCAWPRNLQPRLGDIYRQHLQDRDRTTLARWTCMQKCIEAMQAFEPMHMQLFSPLPT